MERDSASADRPTIAYLLDGSPADAELVTSPALAGLELAAREAGDVEIEPLNVGLEHEEVMASVRQLGEDPNVVAAVVAPWTAPPDGAIDLLADQGVPIISFSWAWGPPDDGEGVWLSLVAERAREAVILLSRATRSAPDGARLCLAGDDHVTSRALLATAKELGAAAGDPELVMAGITESGNAATADAVAHRIEDARCPTLVWIGSATEASPVLSSIQDPPAVVGTSRMKNDGGLAIASSGTAVHTVCACEDLSLSTQPIAQRFVHDLQAESGAAPGPFAVEAYDAGSLLIELLAGEGSRRELATALDALTGFGGLGGTYAFEPGGSRSPASSGERVWRAAGSRWLPEPPPGGPPE